MTDIGISCVKYGRSSHKWDNLNKIMSFHLSGSLFDKLVSISRVRWQRVLEDSRIMRSYLQKVNLIVFDGLTKERGIAMYLFSVSVCKLVRKSGLLFTALYLKQCSASLQQAYGGRPQPKARLPVLVSLTGSGLPRIIPPFHRRIILGKGPRSGPLVQLYLSAFSLSKVIALAPKVSVNTFRSIVSPPVDLPALVEFAGQFRDSLRILTWRYMRWISTIPLYQGMTWRPTWKSVPTFNQAKQWFIKEGVKEKNGRKITYFHNIFSSQLFELSAYTFLIEQIHALGQQWSPGSLWFSRVRYPHDSKNKVFSNLDLTYYETYIGPLFPSHHDLGIPPVTGRLGQSVEGGGKRRIFAIGNYINQRLLFPVHKFLMTVLRRLPSDGTFNQTKPLERLVPASKCFSFDLKAATDRFPLTLLFEVMQSLFDRSFASAVVNSTLAFNRFDVPFVKRRHSGVSFITGQPLGYYSSWPLFALTHHYLVWWCADQVKPGAIFSKYAILGDDVLITDPLVASMYEHTLARIGVVINYQKSLVSDTGAAEFGKRFRAHNLEQDLSPVSIRALMNWFHPFGLISIADRYKVRRFTTLARIGGAGFRTVSRLASRTKQSKKFDRARIMMSKPRSDSDFPFEIWLGHGYPLDPYIRGKIIEIIRSKLRPKELRLPPEELFVTPKVMDFGEYTTIRSWVSMWLEYCHWYFKVIMDPDIDLGSVVKAPELKSDWRARSEDMEEVIRFGMIWKLFDLVGSQGVRWNGTSYEPIWYSSPALPEPSDLAGWILGSHPLHPFLVRMEGLTQPSVRGGVFPKEAATRTIIYKTLGVSERIVVMGYR